MHAPIYLIRHGETEWNRAGRLQGHGDSALTPLGRAQAALVGRTLRTVLDGHGPPHFVVSPLGRTRATASIVAEAMGLPDMDMAHDDRLREVAFGDWEGRRFDEIERETPGTLARRDADVWRFVPPGGESYAMLAARIRPFLDDITQPGTRPLVIVSHGGTGRVMRGLYLRLGDADTLAQDQPQGAFYRLSHGTAARIEADEEA